jgi:hypothetical protein
MHHERPHVRERDEGPDGYLSQDTWSCARAPYEMCGQRATVTAVRLDKEHLTTSRYPGS